MFFFFFWKVIIDVSCSFSIIHLESIVNWGWGIFPNFIFN